MAQAAVRPELYCVVPRDLADEVVEPLRRHLGAQDVAVIVERRDTRASVPFEVRRQRALHLPRALPPLPPELGPHAEQIKLVQRMPSPGLTYADNALLEVVDAARADDSVAASELVWRVHARVATRLTRRQAGTVTNAFVDRVLGAVLDRLGEFGGHEELDFLFWLDEVVDDV